MRSEPSSFTAAPPRVVAVLCAFLAGLPAARVDAAADVSYDRLDALLARHVRDGLVDYAALKTDPTLRISGIRSRTPLRRREDIEKLGQAYRLAGVPE